MRTALFGVVVVASVVTGAIAIRAQGPQASRRVVYISSDRGRIVTVSRNGNPIVSLSVPVGTAMALVYDSQAEPNLMAKPLRVHGAVQVKMLRDSEIRGPLGEAMLLAPVVVGGDNVDVEVDTPTAPK